MAVVTMMVVTMMVVTMMVVTMMVVTMMVVTMMVVTMMVVTMMVLYLPLPISTSGIRTLMIGHALNEGNSVCGVWEMCDGVYMKLSRECIPSYYVIGKRLYCGSWHKK